MYKCILFDLDGTLTDPKEGITKCVQYALAYFGIDEPDLDSLRCFIGPPLKNSFMEHYGMDEAQAAEAVLKYRERYRDTGIFENKVYDGINSMLARLVENCKVLAVATSKPAVFAEQILEEYGMDGYFSFVAGSELDGSRTDKAEVIAYALNGLGVADTTGVVMVGDRKHDIIGARKCGVSSIGVRFGYAEEGELETAGAGRIADSVEELVFMLSQ